MAKWGIVLYLLMNVFFASGAAGKHGVQIRVPAEEHPAVHRRHSAGWLSLRRTAGPVFRLPGDGSVWTRLVQGGPVWAHSCRLITRFSTHTVRAGDAPQLSRADELLKAVTPPADVDGLH